MSTFSPIAIVGRACVLPGALSPQALWDAVATGRDLISSVPAGRWGMRHEDAICDPGDACADRTWSDRGGYVTGFEMVWDPSGFAIPARELEGLDPLVLWALHAAREALVGVSRGERRARAAEQAPLDKGESRTGAIFGNLGFPSPGMAQYAQGVWTGSGDGDARNRFVSSGAARVLGDALALDAGSFCLDAACASSLYAIKLACDRLQEGSADLMLAGAVQGADDLFLHIGFCALNALSKSGQSRPFHADADGLLPAEGAAFVALKRLADARRDGDHIFGVIRGIGLSNDGRGKGLLAPAEEGQQRAMRAAFVAAGLHPGQVSLIECHATGTPVGDATELRSTAAVYAGSDDLPIGSLKSNLGHLITTAGAAGLIKVLEALRSGQRPPTLHAEIPNAALACTPFRLLHALEEWPAETPRIAAVSAFGFGGNNAHLLVSEEAPEIVDSTLETSSEPIAIIGIGCMAAGARDRAAFAAELFGGKSQLNADGEARIEEIALELQDLRFPPNDLLQSLPQQLGLLQSARAALAESGALPRERTGIYIGMEPDPEVARHGLRWRLANHEHESARLQAARDQVIPALEAAAVLGSMPNIPANRLSSQFDLAGPGFTVQAGAASGTVAIDLALRALRRGEIDAALVGAVDFSCEAVQRSVSELPPGDAAMAIVLKRLGDAERAVDRVYALIEVATPGVTIKSESPQLATRFGAPYAASGMLEVVAAALHLHHRHQLDGMPWLSVEPRSLTVQPDGPARPALVLREAVNHPSRSESELPRLHSFAGRDRADVMARLRGGESAGTGPARLVLVATDADLGRIKARALAHLETGAPAGTGIHFAERPIGGEIAFVFAGAGASYAGMGRELLLHLPQLVPTLALRSKRLSAALEWAFVEGHQPSAIEQLWGASALAQLHLELSRGLLGLAPDAWLGYSSGETNALFAAGIWTDADELMDESERSGLMTRELGGEFAAVERCWGAPVDWASWTVLASPEDVLVAIGEMTRVHLAIIQSDEESLIAGDAGECSLVVERLGPARCVRLDYPLAVHVPELREVGARWLELHRRQTFSSVPGRIYSNALGRAYQPDTESCARAILDQATHTLDLRPAILSAWNDGVRVFIEHGPGGSYSRAIRSVLGQREALVVSLDRKGQGIEGLLNAVAALMVAGVPVNVGALETALPRVVVPAKSGRTLKVPAHAPVIDWERISGDLAKLVFQMMEPAPRLPPVLGAPKSSSALSEATPELVAPALRAPTSSPALQAAMPALGAPILGGPTSASALAPLPAGTPALPGHLSLLASLARVQQEFVLAQQAAHEQFMGLQQRAMEILVGVAACARSAPALVSGSPRGQQSEARDRGHGRSHDETKDRGHGRSHENRSNEGSHDGPRGPRFSRAQLEVHSGGRISEIFGPGFAPQDSYLRQVRMPLPPLLLADRVVGLDAQPRSMGKGRIWTETDVRRDSWYLHHDHMPAGVMIEAGQADLMLISWLGVDLLNRGERVYRLLGCELTYHGDLPRSGETLRFEISLDGHAAQGDVRLMFFHYDCVNFRGDDGEPRKQLSVRQGQAGFFTDAELEASAGCLWSPATQSIVPNPTLDAPTVECTRSELSRADLEAFARGNAFACFGPGFERARTHTRSPAIHQGSMLLLDRVSALENAGGRWQRGYLRAELDITPDQWFFDGHFKNDPCMPGTLMFEACLQALALFLAARGYTLERDGWRFQPVPEVPYQLQCRGQVTPRSRLLVTEVFVEEVSAGPIPTVFADLLCTVDGLKAFHARRVGLQLVPDWPLDFEGPTALDDEQLVAVVDGFPFDQRSLLACALGRPTQAFGPMYARFDGPQRVARLPSPPYLFASRVASVTGPIGVMKAGARCVIEYDVPPDAWYFDANDGRTMPFAVLLEAALQPCGWLSSYVGSALTIDSELGFRNLDGKGTLHAEIHPDSGTLITEVELLEVSATAGMIIESFAVRCRIGLREVYTLRTVFGFFPPAALAAQAGLPTTRAQREILERASEYRFDLSAAASWETRSALSNPDAPPGGARLRMLDRVDGWWPGAGAAGLGQLRAVKDIDADEWFFKAHFFQDPVQPGSLGIEAMIQLLAFYMLETGMDAGIVNPRFESLAIDREHTWKYRGQVLPHHRRVHTTIEILERASDERGTFAVASASLWADGRWIYEAPALGLRIVPGRT